MRRGKIAPVLSANPLKMQTFLVRALSALSILAALIWFPAVSAELPPAAPAPGPGVPADYRIGPGDTLKVYVFQNEELSATVPVRPDGKISTPLVEDMVAVGKSPSQLARDIEKSLAEYVKSPKVNVVVMLAVSVFSQVKIIGQVKSPQALPYRDGMTVLDAVLAVGGLGQFAAGNRAHIVRDESGKQTEIKVKLDALLNNGDMKQNLLLKPGDVLVVPETRF
ncbi:MAG TPA: XrtA/PEP-CTERM system exopolysaccharide export protein [Rhizomicrobium sp.]|jgi:polysaccharide export outer membrane protein|nr:XrtA/PEP-CTERM system exopolysaccharide export protein [Rhizomicrobium sp.]